MSTPAQSPLLNGKRSPIEDNEIQQYLWDERLDFGRHWTKRDAYFGAHSVVIATPTDCDPDTNCFVASLVESVIADVLAINPGATIVIKSTIPAGFTIDARQK
ncbi:MAG: UDP-glucose 6-dehydrogenase, partial [Steroidobacteraceae bacterium]